MFLTSLIAAQATCSAAALDWRAAAENTLRNALAEKHRDISRWELHPLLTNAIETRVDEMDVVDMAPVQFGVRSAVRIRGKRNGRMQSVNVWFAVHGYRQLKVAGTALRSGTPFTNENVVAGEADVLGIRCEVPDQPDFWVGMRAKHTLDAGDPVCADAIEPVPMVSRGEGVTVKSISGPVTITARGVAEQDGDLGNVVRIKNSASGEVFTAAVVGRREVIVRE
ncbi:MAG TPA: flagellar basal body P-ring formation chaperone FlgA [Steroidobacteraceae bacterium]|nr:flagellar basal body P-ring formation chaperone FlgA [Steroidobacteraceae bacterium]